MKIIYAVVFLGALVSSGCGGGGGSVSSPSIVPISVTVSPSSASVQSGDNQTFTALVTGSPDISVTWQVNGVPGGSAQAGTITAAGVYTSPSLQFASSTVTITAIAHADTSKSASSQMTVGAAHQIGTSQQGGFGEFIDRQTGAEIRLRGNHYIRLATQQTLPLPGAMILYHSTFNVGVYDPAQVEAALTRMSQIDKYNVVSVFLNGCCANTLQGQTGVSSAYVTNVVDFLKRANAHGIYVILAMDVVTFPPYGNSFFQSCCGKSQIDGINLMALSQGGIDAHTAFWTDFLHEAIRQHAPLSTVAGYLVIQEFYYDASLPPLSLTSGLVTTANGKTYNMADQASRQAMMDENMVNFTNKISDVIHAIDPSGLVGIGFFQPQSPNPTRVGDPRLTHPFPAIASSNADFIKLSIYPVKNDLTLLQFVQNFGFVGFQQKPITMGEYGAFEFDYADAASAAQALKDWQVGSCSFNFKGWLLWTWDTPVVSQGIWSAVDGSGEIDQALSPVNRPDPCLP
jgi:hypothetical protein